MKHQKYQPLSGNYNNNHHQMLNPSQHMHKSTALFKSTPLGEKSAGQSHVRPQKYWGSSYNTTIKCPIKNNNTKKSSIKKLIIYQPVQQPLKKNKKKIKLKTQNSSLSCSTLNKMNLSLSKQSKKANKNMYNNNSQYLQTSSNKKIINRQYNNKSKRSTYSTDKTVVKIYTPHQSSDKKGVKSMMIGQKSKIKLKEQIYANIIVRTKSLLSQYQDKQKSWQCQRQNYNNKISQLSSQIMDLKQKIVQNQSKQMEYHHNINKFHNVQLQ